MKWGRPRTTCPPEEEIPILGEDLVEWATGKPMDNRDKRTAWQFWYALRHGMTREMWKRLLDTPSFRPYYEIAQAAMIQNLHSDDLKEGITQRYLRVFDRILRDEEDADKDADLQRKVKAARSLGDSAKAQLSEFLDKEKS